MNQGYYQSADTMEMKSGGGPAAIAMDDNQPRLTNDIGTCKLLCPSCLSCCLGSIFPCGICCLQVNAKNESVLLSFGTVVGTLRRTGIYCVNQHGLEVKKVSTAMNSMDISKLKVVDSNGNPLIMSGVVNWAIRDAVKATVDVANYHEYLRAQAEIVLKQIVSLHPYESKPGALEDHSLKKEADKIRRTIVELLQAKVERAGIRILEYSFTEIQYAPEIAAAMLVRQSADAVLDARKIVVEGAVHIAHGAVQSLKDRGIQLDNAEISRLASNLVITICSESRVLPTINLSA